MPSFPLIRSILAVAVGEILFRLAISAAKGNLMLSPDLGTALGGVLYYALALLTAGYATATLAPPPGRIPVYIMASLALIAALGPALQEGHPPLAWPYILGVTLHVPAVLLGGWLRWRRSK